MGKKNDDRFNESDSDEDDINEPIIKKDENDKSKENSVSNCCVGLSNMSAIKSCVYLSTFLNFVFTICLIFMSRSSIDSLTLFINTVISVALCVFLTASCILLIRGINLTAIKHELIMVVVLVIQTLIVSSSIVTYVYHEVDKQFLDILLSMKADRQIMVYIIACIYFLVATVTFIQYYFLSKLTMNKCKCQVDNNIIIDDNIQSNVINQANPPSINPNLENIVVYEQNNK